MMMWTGILQIRIVSLLRYHVRMEHHCIDLSITVDTPKNPKGVFRAPDDCTLSQQEITHTTCDLNRAQS